MQRASQIWLACWYRRGGAQRILVGICFCGKAVIFDLLLKIRYGFCSGCKNCQKSVDKGRIP